MSWLVLIAVKQSARNIKIQIMKSVIEVLRLGLRLINRHISTYSSRDAGTRIVSIPSMHNAISVPLMARVSLRTPKSTIEPPVATIATIPTSRATTNIESPKITSAAKILKSALKY